MSDPEFTLADLRRLLREAAGEADGVGLDGDILNVSFIDLGYESLALLETGSRIAREFGVYLRDTAIADAETPAALIALVKAAVQSTGTATDSGLVIDSGTVKEM
jgi:act minimal PKS acyl carrier protein